MKWVSVNNGTAQENFELWGDDKKLAGISFSNTSRIARMVGNFGKRLFFFENKGLFTSKTIFKNEYGIKMGMIEEIKKGKGYVELDGRKYAFIYNENNSGELMLYDDGTKKNLLTCSFDTFKEGFVKATSLLDTKFPGLLMALCLYTFQPKNTVFKEAVIF